MPTGYTDIIEKGCTFEEYVWRCARAFGALVTERDESFDKRAPDRFAVPTWHETELAKAMAQLRYLSERSPGDLAAELAERREELERLRSESKAKCEELATRYSAIRERVKLWKPPTQDHEGMKKFMLEQIETCRTDWEYRDYYGALPESVEAYYQQALEKAKRDIDYHAAKHAEEVSRTEGRNAWLAALRASVPQP